MGRVSSVIGFFAAELISFISFPVEEIHIQSFYKNYTNEM